MADSFPFYYDYERTISDLTNAGYVMRRVVDTTRYRSDVRRSYRPGGLVEWGRGADEGNRVIRLPTLALFADSVFVWSHCWTEAESHDGTLAGLAFRPAAVIGGADVEGTAWLDPASFALQRLEFALTRVQLVVPRAASVTTAMEFREWYPGLVVPAVVSGATAAARFRGTLQRVWTVTEVQRLLRVQHLRARLQ